MSGQHSVVYVDVKRSRLSFNTFQVSYAILEPGEIPKIHGVTRYVYPASSSCAGCQLGGRFPGQEHVAGNSKIPSILYYDKHGQLKAAGAEADNAQVQAQAEDDGWTKVEL